MATVLEPPRRGRSSTRRREPGRLSVLCLEDDAFEAQLIERRLRRDAREIVKLARVTTLAEARRWLERHHPDVILADLHLPDARGGEVIGGLRAAAPDVPIVAVSGVGDRRLARESIRGGSQDFLDKSAVASEGLLVRAVELAIHRHRQVESLRTRDRDERARLERLAFFDPLTEALNRHGLESALRQILGRAIREGDDTSLVLIDLDHFKDVNDTFGHEVGDRALKEVVAATAEALRGGDVLARLGGDEFLVVLPRTSSSDAEAVGERIRLAVRGAAFENSGERVPLSASIGVVTIPASERPMEEVFSLVDQALFRSKRSGRDRVTTALLMRGSREDEERLVARLTSGERLRLVSQPILHLESRARLGCEVLIRSSIQGLEAPRDIFDIAQHVGGLVELDRACLKRALRLIESGQLTGLCHINVFPETLKALSRAELAELRDINRESGRLAVLEVSAAALRVDDGELAAAVARLRGAGGLFALDDVTFEARALQAVLMLQPDRIKLDMLALSELSEDAFDDQLQRLLLATQRLGIDVQGERVAEPRDCQRLMRHSIRSGQGFALAHPEPLNPS